MIAELEKSDSIAVCIGQLFTGLFHNSSCDWYYEEGKFNILANNQEWRIPVNAGTEITYNEEAGCYDFQYNGMSYSLFP